MSDSDVPDLVGSSDEEIYRRDAAAAIRSSTRFSELQDRRISDDSSIEGDPHNDNALTEKKRKKKKKSKKKNATTLLDGASTTVHTEKQENIVSSKELLTAQMTTRWKNVLDTVSELQLKGPNGLKDMKFSWVAQKFAYDVIVENSEEERRHQELTADVIAQTDGVESKEDDEHNDWYIDAPELLSLNDENPKLPSDTSVLSNKTHMSEIDNELEVNLNACIAVDLSQSVKKWLERADAMYRGMFKRRIYQLASGQRSYALSKRLKHVNMPIYETKLDAGQRILWSQILRISHESDPIRTATTTNGSDVTLMIWYVAKHDSVPVLLKQIEHSYGRTIKQIEKRLNIADNQELNAITLKFISCSTEIQRVPMLAIPDEAVLLDPQANIPLKIYPVLDLSTLAYPNWRAPLRLNKIEQSVRSQRGTVLLLGRSGTGKTLCLMDRMQHDRLQLLHQHHYRTSTSSINSSAPRPSQLFVARSLQLCELVKRYQTNNIMDTAATTVPATSTTTNTEIDNYFMRMRQFLVEIEKRMIASINSESTSTPTTSTASTTATVLFHHTHRDKDCIDFNRFNQEIYPVITGNYHSKLKNTIILGRGGGNTKDTSFLLDSLIVWTQIRSFLKGSIDSILAGEGGLPLSTYTDFEVFGKDRCRLQVDQRCQAYELFLHYELYRTEHGLWDEMDRVQYILSQAFRHTPITSTGFHTEALFLAGDPAQSVVEGVDFRFEEVRSLVYKLTSGRDSIERPIKLLANYRSHTGVLTCAAAIIDKLLLMFPGSANVLMKDEGLFTGPRPNYCHVSDPTEILRLLGKGVAVLTHDHSAWLQRPKPIDESVSELTVDGATTTNTELGDEIGAGTTAATTITTLSNTPPTATSITILELGNTVMGIRAAKGLEFSDVMVLDFFSSISPEDTKAWKVLFGDKAEVLVRSQQYSYPQLEPQLKMLYTAITRSMNRLIFVETKKTTASEVFFRWLQAQGFADKFDLNTARQQPEQRFITCDEWKVRGIQFALQADNLNTGNTSISSSTSSSVDMLYNALNCFQNANDSDLKHITHLQISLLHAGAHITDIIASDMNTNAASDNKPNTFERKTTLTQSILRIEEGLRRGLFEDVLELSQALLDSYSVDAEAGAVYAEVVHSRLQALVEQSE